MSLINEMLNDLERRGEHAPLGEPTIRAIPPRKPSYLLRYGLPVALLLSALAAAKWYVERAETMAIEPIIVPVRPGQQPAPPLADAAALTATPLEGSTVAAMTEIDAPASKLSFELSSIPLPSSLRSKPASSAKDAAPQAAPVRKAAAQPERQQARSKVADRSGTTPAASSDQSPFKQISPRQHAENEYRKANQAAQQGRTDEAIAGYEGVLRLDPLYHEARRALVGVFLNAKRNADAERVLQEGLKRDSRESSFAMLLARLQVERDAIPLALETLQKNLPHAERRPEYQAFVAALLQRQDRHQEAIAHFQIALQLVPGNGVWLMGLGISLQAVQRNEDAREAYRRALGSNSLNPQLQEFVQKKLREL
jgi:MSHA biogenesis protein MshN